MAAERSLAFAALCLPSSETHLLHQSFIHLSRSPSSNAHPSSHDTVSGRNDLIGRRAFARFRPALPSSIPGSPQPSFRPYRVPLRVPPGFSTSRGPLTPCFRLAGEHSLVSDPLYPPLTAILLLHSLGRLSRPTAGHPPPTLPHVLSGCHASDRLTSTPSFPTRSSLFRS